MTTPTKLIKINGEWTYVPLSAEEIAERDAMAEASDLDMTNVRQQRNALLAQSDWTQLADSVLSDAQRVAWANYREALRDLPQNFSKVSEVVWPDQP